MKTLAHRWPTALGVIAAVLVFLESPDRAEVALVAAIAATCYVAAATFALPWMAWAWIPIGFVVVAAGRLVGLHRWWPPASPPSRSSRSACSAPAPGPP
jgi:hypothetical protein